MTKITDREIVLGILLCVIEDGQFSHQVLKNTLEKYQCLGKQNRAFISRLAEGTLERCIELDFIINQYSKVKVNKMKPVVKEILRMGVYQILYMDAVPDSAACNEAVKLAKKKGFGSLSGFVNGVLRTIAREKKSIKYPDKEAEPVKFLSICYSIPEWIVNRFIYQYGFETAETICSSTLKEKPLTIRTTLGRVSPEELEIRLKEEGITVQRGTYFNFAWKISKFNYLGSSTAFQDGAFIVQDESSMLPAVIAGIRENDRILDVCAAPGGKCLHAADLLKGTGYVEARDVSEQKIKLIEQNRIRVHCQNLTVKVWDARITNPDSIEQFDVVFADVPCSGLGIIGKKNDIKYKITEEKQEELVNLQRDIISVISAYVKPGGVLIYSTCTVDETENIQNIDWILHNFDYNLESMEELLPDKLKGMTGDKGFLQLLPGIQETDGFFLAKLRKRFK